MGPKHSKGEDHISKLNEQNKVIKRKNKLRCMHTNLDQFPNKKEVLLTFIVDDEPDIIMITEMIPKAQINPILMPLLDIPGYYMYANFDNEEVRLGASGIRGVAIYTKYELSVREVITTEQHKDQIWVEISLIGKDIPASWLYLSQPNKWQQFNCRKYEESERCY